MFFKNRKDKINFLKDLSNGKISMDELLLDDAVTAYRHDTEYGFCLTSSEDPLQPGGQKGVPYGFISKRLLNSKQPIIFQ
jgi:hypothetical protein